MGSYVYMIKNRENGKAYIGMTDSVEYRTQHHFRYLRHNRHKIKDFQNDFNKYGEDAFCVRTLGKFSEKEASRMETFYQRLFRTNEREYGYNYKDKKGTSKNAIDCRWRESANLWPYKKTQWGYLKKLWSMPIEKRHDYTIKKYRTEIQQGKTASA